MAGASLPGEECREFRRFLGRSTGTRRDVERHRRGESHAQRGNCGIVVRDGRARGYRWGARPHALSIAPFLRRTRREPLVASGDSRPRHQGRLEQLGRGASRYSEGPGRQGRPAGHSGIGPWKTGRATPRQCASHTRRRCDSHRPGSPRVRTLRGRTRGEPYRADRSGARGAFRGGALAVSQSARHTSRAAASGAATPGERSAVRFRSGTGRLACRPERRSSRGPGTASQSVRRSQASRPSVGHGDRPRHVHRVQRVRGGVLRGEQRPGRGRRGDVP